VNTFLPQTLKPDYMLDDMDIRSSQESPSSFVFQYAGWETGLIQASV
jgi:hypothetical protein